MTLDIKLADFGFATYFDEQQLLVQELGSPYYMPPEILNHQKYNSKIDVWSAGVSLYFFLTSELPFKGQNKEELFENIKNQDISSSFKNIQNLSKNCKDFLKKCLYKDQQQRQSAEQLLNHPWLYNPNELVELSEKEAQQLQLNMSSFVQADSNFLKTIISLISGLMIQKQELQDLKQKFKILDRN